MKKYISKIIYHLIAKRLPISYSKFNVGQRKIRYWCTKHMINFCGKNVNIEKNASFSEQISIGDNSGIGINADIRGKCIIGENVLMGPNCTIYSQNHNFSDCSIPIIKQGMSQIEPVTIGDDVWIGKNVTILPGVNIGSHSIIGACAVVTKDIPEWAIAVGNPAIIKKYRKNLII